VLRKPLANALTVRRETIRSEIAKAENERAQAAEQLAEAQALLAHVDADVEAARKLALEEVTEERQRQAEATEREIARLKIQTEREIELARKASRRSLEQFLATRSLQLAKQSVISQLRPEDDDRFIRERLDELRRARG